MSSAVFKKQIQIFEKYFKRNDVVEIIVNQEGEVCLETVTGDWEFKNDKNITIEAIRVLTTTMATLSGQAFGLDVPVFSGRIPDYGFRIQVNIGAQVESGVMVAIRVGQSTIYPINSYMNDDDANRLIDMVIKGKTILINAGTGCGKTTFLNSLISHIPSHLRIVTLEDTRELIIPHRNKVCFLKSKTNTDIAGLGYSHYINTMMRARPDRILLGEIDIENTMVFLNIANSGHSGSISTIHAENKEEALNKLCLNAALAGSQGSKTDNMEYAKSAIDVFVSLKKEIINGKRVFSADISEM